MRRTITLYNPHKRIIPCISTVKYSDKDRECSLLYKKQTSPKLKKPRFRKKNRGFISVEKRYIFIKRGLGRSPKAGRRDASPRIHPLSGERGQGDRDNKSEVNFKNRLFLQTGICNHLLQERRRYRAG